MKKIIIITIIFFSSNTIANTDTVWYRPAWSADSYRFGWAASYPRDCEMIRKLDDDRKYLKNEYVVKDKDLLKDLAYKCGFYLAGKSVNDAAKSTSNAIKDTSKEIYESTGAKSLIDGLFGNDD